MIKGFVTDLAKAERIFAFGDEIVVLANSVDTGGTFCLFQQVYTIPDWGPLHFHEYEDHFVLITQGAMEFELSGIVYACSAGNGIFMPRQQWHRFRATSAEPVVMLIFNFPGGFENMYREIASADTIGAGEPTRQEILRKYGVRTQQEV